MVVCQKERMTESMMRLGRWARWVPAAAAVLIAAWIAGDTFVTMAIEHAALPFWDGWGTVSEYRDLLSGRFGFVELFAQHNEHRIAAGRLLFFTDILAFDGRGVFLSVCIGAILAGLAALLIWIARPAKAVEWRLYAISAAAAVGCLLSLLATENLLWTFQAPFVLLYLSAALGLYGTMRACEAAGAGRAWAGWLTVAIVALVTAVFCMANGLAALALAIALAALLRGPKLLIAILAILFAALTAIYFHGYVSPSKPGGLQFVLEHPDILLDYMLAFIGNLLRNTAASDRDSLLLGAFGFLLCGGVAWRILVLRDFDAPRLILTGMMLFVLAAALASGVGRLADFGQIQAYAPRYVTPTAVFWACQALYWSSAAREGPIWLRLAPATGSCLLLWLLVQGQQLSRPDAAALLARITREADATLVGVRDNDADLGTTPFTENLPRDIELLRQKGKSIFAEPRARWMGRPLASFAKADGQCLGAIDKAAPLPNDPSGLKLEGWSWDTRHDRRVEQLIIVGADGRVVGLASGGEFRPDVIKAVREVDHVATGWFGYARGVSGDVLTVYGMTGSGQVCPLGAKTATR